MIIAIIVGYIIYIHLYPKVVFLFTIQYPKCYLYPQLLSISVMIIGRIWMYMVVSDCMYDCVNMCIIYIVYHLFCLTPCMCQLQIHMSYSESDILKNNLI